MEVRTNIYTKYMLLVVNIIICLFEEKKNLLNLYLQLFFHTAHDDTFF